MYFGAVDIGTNSCRLLIADRTYGEQLRTIVRAMEITRIGDNINSVPILQEEAIVRTLDCLRRFGQQLQGNSVQRYRAIATSAVRDAKNRDEFISRALLEAGMAIEIVSGEEEARLSYAGVKEGLHLNQEPLVVDLGGGSTEFICPKWDLLLSIPAGAVRATEANMSAAQISAFLKRNGIMAIPATLPVVFVGGTATSLVTIKKGLADYDPNLIHGEILTRGEVDDLYNLLEGMPPKLRRRLPGLQPERADIINKGVLTILVIMELLGKEEIIISESDLLEGIISTL